MKKLCVLGSINVDHIISVPYFVKPGETLTGRDYHLAYGGKGANQAVAAARLGADVSFIACIGDDEIGQSMKKAFEQESIDTQAIQVIPQQKTGVAIIQLAQSGENAIVIASGANAYLDTKIVQQNMAKIAQCDYLLIQLETPLTTVIFAAQQAKKLGKKTMLNPAPAQTLPDELLGCVDIITPNETETEILTGIKVIDKPSAVQAGNFFHQKGVQTVLITLGEKGVFVSEKNGESNIIPAFKVQTIDTTAAGDTFNGALVSALLANQNLNQAVFFACAAAAICVSKKGAQPSIPTKQQTLDFLSLHKVTN